MHSTKIVYDEFIDSKSDLDKQNESFSLYLRYL